LSICAPRSPGIFPRHKYSKTEAYKYQKLAQLCLNKFDLPHAADFINKLLDNDLRGNTVPRLLNYKIIEPREIEFP
jgi:hypothetical protein